LIVLRHALEPRVQLLALDGGGDLGADVLQQFLVLFGVTLAARQAFDDQRTDGAVFEFSGTPSQHGESCPATSAAKSDEASGLSGVSRIG
jgi:hypothetical protein